MNNNMMLMMLLDGKDGGKGDLAEVMMLASMMSGSGNANPLGNFMINPMEVIALSGRGGGSLKDILMLQMIQGANLAKPAAPVATPVAPEAPVVE
jgi:hypothetical protein